MAETQVTIKLKPHEYRTLRMELSYTLDSLKAEYSANASKWGDQNPDRIAFASRIERVRALRDSI